MGILRETNEGNIRLVNGLLELARADHAGTAAAETADLTAAVDDALRELTPLGESANITAHSNLEQRATVQGDATLLRHLARNLQHNAMSHNGPRGWRQIKLTAPYKNIE